MMGQGVIALVMHLEYSTDSDIQVRKCSLNTVLQAVNKIHRGSGHQVYVPVSEISVTESGSDNCGLRPVPRGSYVFRPAIRESRL